MTNTLVLASASPRRYELLCQIDRKPHEVLPANIDEAVRAKEPPHLYAKRIAHEKAKAIAAMRPGCFVLAGDTVVALGRRVLPKAEDGEVARRCLEALSGRRHRVYGGICLISPAGMVSLRLSTTQVSFKRLTPGDIASYLASKEWAGKAGGYAIQGRAAAFIPWINGSYSNVVGLDLAHAMSMLSGMGYDT